MQHAKKVDKYVTCELMGKKSQMDQGRLELSAGGLTPDARFTNASSGVSAFPLSIWFLYDALIKFVQIIVRCACLL